MSLVYGYDVKSYDDHLLVVARKMAELGGAVLPGSILVNELPLCKHPPLDASRTTDPKGPGPFLVKHIPAWIPWLSYKPAAQAGFYAGQDVLRYPMEFVKDGFVRLFLFARGERATERTPRS